MIVIVVVDDRNGMTFNHRRLSQDKVLRAYILDLAKKNGRKLWMNAYTRKLFKDLPAADESFIVVDEDFLANAPDGDYCYVENVAVKPYEMRIESIQYCLWNRRYPADTYWDIDMSAWTLTGTTEFPGSSHENITVNSYSRG